MTPFRRGQNGAFSIYVPTGPGYKQRSTGTTDPRLARRIEAMVKQLADAKQWDLLRAVAVTPATLTIDALWHAYQSNAVEALRARLSAQPLDVYREGWALDAQQVAPASWRDMHRQLDRLLGAMGPGLPAIDFAHELTAGTVRDRINALAVSGGTARHYLYALSSFCNYLVAHAALPSNPCDSRVLVPRPKKSNKRKVWKTADVDQNIVDRTNGDIRVALTLCAASGADRATPLLMRVRDVHLLPFGVDTDPAVHREHRVDLPGTKVEGRDRKGVRLEPWARAILREAIEGKLPDAPLITGVSTDMLTRHWQAAATAAGQGGYWLRDTRHSYGVRAILAGYPLWEVSAWLGHANEAITAAIYTQLEYEVARRIREGTISGSEQGKMQSTTTATTTQPTLSLTRREA